MTQKARRDAIVPGGLSAVWTMLLPRSTSCCPAFWHLAEAGHDARYLAATVDLRVRLRVGGFMLQRRTDLEIVHAQGLQLAPEAIKSIVAATLRQRPEIAESPKAF